MLSQNPKVGGGGGGGIANFGVFVKIVLVKIGHHEETVTFKTFF